MTCVAYGYQQLPELPAGKKILTLGNFDGCHRGHQQLFEQMFAPKTENGFRIIYTFSPHPQHYFQPQSPIPLLMTEDEKNEVFRKKKFDLIIQEPFTRSFSELKPEDFFQNCICKKLQVSQLIIGHDFAFGKARSGQLSQLQSWCAQAQMDLQIVPAYRSQGAIVSSSLIRKYLLDGHIEAANQQLGYRFFYQGPILPGAGRGKQLGFPTYNLEYPSPPKSYKLGLPYGVYATYSRNLEAAPPNQWLRSITHLGIRPTFSDTSSPQPAAAWIETHLLETPIPQHLEYQKLEIQFLSRIREERRFDSPQALQNQIHQDIQTASDLHHLHPPNSL